MKTYVINDKNQPYKHRMPYVTVSDKRFTDQVLLTQYIGETHTSSRMTRQQAAELLKNSEIIK